MPLPEKLPPQHGFPPSWVARQHQRLGGLSSERGKLVRLLVKLDGGRPTVNVGGELVWQSGSLGLGFGASGSFYSTPAVAFGRVYAGNTDGRVYSFETGGGELAWSYSTGGYVYSGPTVAGTRHSPPTVFIGSFDGNVYALGAKNGNLRWSRDAGGQVIGSLSAVGDIVYVAEFTHKTTTGFMMRSGRRVWRYPKGTYTPVISDGRRIFLTGYSSITALRPHRAVVAVAAARPARKPGKGRSGGGRGGR